MFKAIHIFLQNYSVLPDFDILNDALLDEWGAYWNDVAIESDDFNIVSFWEQKTDEYLILSEVALKVLWIPASTADVERSFSLLKTLETPQRLQMSDSHVRDHMYCYFNSKYIYRLSSFTEYMCII